ncbi:DUF2283 domain-containing protein [Picosynechococcus sp. PCC 7117]|uniref:DUF2283 domain-containing protein n=1 Tax=Picosynechococcus sp. PCC 7117 TaxID=195498 RepID=UPI001E2D2E37|nr:DUF2283 domain-containing protein [Picosynechococcus sp. PCC 7117]
MVVVEESLSYLKFVPLLQDLQKRLLYLFYDAEADVLYIDFYNPPVSSDDTELMDDDVIIRYGKMMNLWG